MDCRIRPIFRFSQPVAVTVIQTALFFILRRANNSLAVQGHGNADFALARHKQIKNTLHNNACIFINNQFMLVVRVFHITIRRKRPDKLALLLLRPQRRLNLFRYIPRILLIKNIPYRHKHIVLLFGTVYIIVKGNKPHTMLGEYFFDIITRINIISAEAGQVFNNNTIYFFSLYITNHFFKTGAVKISSRKIIIAISFDGIKFILVVFYVQF
jgi:hypothetical protein